MAGHRKGKPKAAVRVNHRRTQRRKRNRVAFREAVQMAGGYSMAKAEGVSTLDVLQELLERVVGVMRWAAKRAEAEGEESFWVELTDAQGNLIVEPSKWHALETAMRAEAADLAERMEVLGIAERQVAVSEMVGGAIADLLNSVVEELDLTPEQRERAPDIVGRHLRALEGGAGSKAA